MTKPKAKRKGIVVTVTYGWKNVKADLMHIVCPPNGTTADEISICEKWLVRAGMKKLKPGESRKVRVTVEEAT